MQKAGSKHTLCSVRRNFGDAGATKIIRHKKVARAVKGQKVRAAQPGGKSALHPARRDFNYSSVIMAFATNRSPELSKANPIGEPNPEAKVLWTPSGVISVTLPRLLLDTNRFWELAPGTSSETATLQKLHTTQRGILKLIFMSRTLNIVSYKRHGKCQAFPIVLKYSLLYMRRALIALRLGPINQLYVSITNAA